ncbi:hypothetical protein P7K49_015218 [Saguinus oedipus]|uniref:Uncharacterized protein n=1 Tax=Saguinus oedipus TaxID=9490 RepID=A0ABQ9V8L6_SAGOE|nr:hypothetical protein P7K49_015218 [Saguinus oedipus]
MVGREPEARLWETFSKGQIPARLATRPSSFLVAAAQFLAPVVNLWCRQAQAESRPVRPQFARKAGPRSLHS